MDFGGVTAKSPSRADGVVPSAFSSYTEMFNALCADYMLMGMTYDDYWNGDPDMKPHYRKAYKLKQRADNAQAHLQGLYIYHALCYASPMFNTLKPQEPMPYMTEPFALTKEEQEERELREHKRKMEQLRAKFMSRAIEINQHRKEGKDGK